MTVCSLLTLLRVGIDISYVFSAMKCFVSSVLKKNEREVTLTVKFINSCNLLREYYIYVFIKLFQSYQEWIKVLVDGPNNNKILIDQVLVQWWWRKNVTVVRIYERVAVFWKNILYLVCTSLCSQYFYVRFIFWIWFATYFFIFF